MRRVQGSTTGDGVEVETTSGVVVGRGGAATGVDVEMGLEVAVGG
jgi:hypothetical protein